MKIKIKTLIIYALVIFGLLLYLNSIYIWVTHLNYSFNAGLLGYVFNPFMSDSSGNFNYDVAQQNTLYSVIFVVGTIITILFVYFLYGDREIVIGDKK